MLADDLQTDLRPAQTSRGPLLAAVAAANEASHAVLASDELHEIASAVVRESLRTGHRALVGCSPVGHMLVGAALAISGGVRAWRPGDATAVLLIDGIVAGPAGLQQAAAHAM